MRCRRSLGLAVVALLPLAAPLAFAADAPLVVRPKMACPMWKAATFAPSDSMTPSRAKTYASLSSLPSSLKVAMAWAFFMSSVDMNES